MQRRYRTCRNNIGPFAERGFFGARRRHAHVPQLQRFHSVLHEARLLLRRFSESESDIGQHQRERNPGKSRARACVKYPPGLRKVSPRRHRIANVLDGGFFRIREPREIHVLIRGDNELKMLGGLGNQPLAMWNFRGKNALQLFGKHLFFMMTFAATRR